MIRVKTWILFQDNMRNIKLALLNDQFYISQNNSALFTMPRLSTLHDKFIE